MFHSTSNHHNLQTNKSVKDTLTFAGVARVSWTQEPWRLLMTLHGYWMSKTAFAARTTKAELRDMGLNEADCRALFSPGHRCLLQLEHKEAQVGSALVHGELSNAEWLHDDLTVTFNFEQWNEELELMMQELQSMST